MEKLIELLNEYWTQKQANANWKEFLEEEKNQIYLIFWMDFIKWLVDNDKIDKNKVPFRYQLEDYTIKEKLLMSLSISDTPIEDLISYLK